MPGQERHSIAPAVLLCCGILILAGTCVAQEPAATTPPDDLAAMLMDAADDPAFEAACARLGGAWDDRIEAAVLRLLHARRYNRTLAREALSELLAGSDDPVALRDAWNDLYAGQQKRALTVLVELRADARGTSDSERARAALAALRESPQIAGRIETLGDWITDGRMAVLIAAIPRSRVTGEVHRQILEVFDTALTRIHGRYGESDVLLGMSNDGVVVAAAGRLSDADLAARARNARTYFEHRQAYSMGFGEEFTMLLRRLPGSGRGGGR